MRHGLVRHETANGVGPNGKHINRLARKGGGGCAAGAPRRAAELRAPLAVTQCCHRVLQL